MDKILEKSSIHDSDIACTPMDTRWKSWPSELSKGNRQFNVPYDTTKKTSIFVGVLTPLPQMILEGFLKPTAYKVLLNVYRGVGETATMTATTYNCVVVLRKFQTQLKFRFFLNKNS